MRDKKTPLHHRTTAPPHHGENVTRDNFTIPVKPESHKVLHPLSGWSGKGMQKSAL